MPTFTVPLDLPAQPVKAFLRKHVGISLTLWRKIKQSDDFSINKKQVPPTLASVRPGDVISYTIMQITDILPISLPLQISYEDEYLLVADKPAGQLVHPTTKERECTLANGILHYYAQNHLSYAYHPVHRLDKNTSGLVLIAKMPHIQHLFSFIDSKNLNRTYQAIVHNSPCPPNGTIDVPISRRPGSIIERMTDIEGQRAVTHYRTIVEKEKYSLLELVLETGRTHQIRVHLSHIGCPILGDDLYGGKTDLIQRQALHASCLRFIHPVKKKPIELFSPLPPDIQTITDTVLK